MAFASTNNDNNKPFFIGGYTATSQKTGKPYYRLNFAVPTNKERDNAFGWDAASLFVQQETYQRFMLSGKFNCRIDAQIIWANGGYALVSYNL